MVLLRPCRGSPTSSGGLPEAVAVAVHRQDMDVVRQAIEQRTGEPLRHQGARPVLERQVRRDDMVEPRS
jgi:hypothetical protein